MPRDKEYFKHIVAQNAADVCGWPFTYDKVLELLGPLPDNVEAWEHALVELGLGEVDKTIILAISEWEEYQRIHTPQPTTSVDADPDEP